MEEISLGFNWDPDMDFVAFRKANPILKKEEECYKVFQMIEQRYIEYKYENE